MSKTSLQKSKGVSKGATIVQAIQNGNLQEVKKVLRKGSTLSFPCNEVGSTPLHLAADMGKVDVVRYLIAKNSSKVDVNCRDKHGWTPLQLACHQGHLDVVEVLLSDATLETNVANESGNTALHYYVRMESQIRQQVLFERLFKEMISCGVMVNSTSNKQETPLHCAAMRGRHQSVFLLLAAKADITIKNSHEESALHLAVRGENLECIKALIRANADINAASKAGTPLELARASHNPQIQQWAKSLDQPEQPGLVTQYATPLAEKGVQRRHSVMPVGGAASNSNNNQPSPAHRSDSAGSPQLNGSGSNIQAPGSPYAPVHSPSSHRHSVQYVPSAHYPPTMPVVNTAPGYAGYPPVNVYPHTITSGSGFPSSDMINNAQQMNVNPYYPPPLTHAYPPPTNAPLYPPATGAAAYPSYPPTPISRNSLNPLYPPTSGFTPTVMPTYPPSIPTTLPTSTPANPTPAASNINPYYTPPSSSSVQYPPTSVNQPQQPQYVNPYNPTPISNPLAGSDNNHSPTSTLGTINPYYNPNSVGRNIGNNTNSTKSNSIGTYSSNNNLSAATTTTNTSSPPARPKKEAPAEKKPATQPPKNLGKYVIGKCIGSGAYGAVYEGMDTETGTNVAIKQVSLAGVPPAELASIMGELNLLKRLENKYIVKYIGFVQDEQHLNIILDIIEGGSLSSVIQKFGHANEQLCARYISQTLLGLDYLHRRGVIHRDIKCGNILVTKKGCVKLADFGIAASVGEHTGDSDARLTTLRNFDQAHSKTGTDEIVGSPYWMAPEVITMQGTSTYSDIWSLACTIIELLTGKPPLIELPPMQAMVAMVSNPHPPLPDSITPECRDFLLKCFQKQPNDRPKARELLLHPWIVTNVGDLSSELSYGNVEGENNSLSISQPNVITKAPVPVNHTMSQPNVLPSTFAVQQASYNSGGNNSTSEKAALAELSGYGTMNQFDLQSFGEIPTLSGAMENLMDLQDQFKAAGISPARY